MRDCLFNRRHFTLLAALLASPCAMAVDRPRVLVVGDSLSAEYGLARGTGWVSLLQKKLSAGKRQTVVINASVSGDTSSGGRSRLAALLKAHQPQVVIIELGGNDALRGLPLGMTQKNLQNMVQTCLAAKSRVLLLGMQMPPNYGHQYAQQFAQMYTQIAREQAVALVPSFLRGVGDAQPPERYFQSDRIHPNEQAQPLLLDNVWPALQKLLP
jgi:acyl-CoA thioesterase I